MGGFTEIQDKIAIDKPSRELLKSLIYVNQAQNNHSNKYA
jgi:hypothetical protein